MTSTQDAQAALFLAPPVPEESELRPTRFFSADDEVMRRLRHPFEIASDAAADRPVRA